MDTKMLEEMLNKGHNKHVKEDVVFDLLVEPQFLLMITYNN